MAAVAANCPSTFSQPARTCIHMSNSLQGASERRQQDAKALTLGLIHHQGERLKQEEIHYSLAMLAESHVS